jgi:glutamate racemase
MTNSSTPNTFKFSPASPIGIFDSGIGGLTVMRRVAELLPNEHLVYFGDTARVPYGTKSQLAVRKYAADDTRILLHHEPKLIVIACNTVSALALDVVKELASPVPVLGVIHAGARLAASESRTQRIGVIGTQATINSNAYHHEIHREMPSAQVFSKACPLFVPLAEEGFARHDATRLIAKDYLAPLLAEHIDTLVLGCTHYPILREVISEVTGSGVTIIDSAEAIAREVQSLLAENALLNTVSDGSRRLMVSDVPQKFKTVAEQFLGFALPDVELVAV